jgi:hypothetical protein
VVERKELAAWRKVWRRRRRQRKMSATAAAAAEDERDGGGLDPVAGKRAARPSK